MIKITFLFYIFIFLFLARSLIQTFLHIINLTHLRRNENKVPDEFRDIIDDEKFKKISNYTIENEKCQMINTLTHQAILLLIVLSGILPWWVGFINKIGCSDIIKGLIFFGSLGFFVTLVRIPFDLYENFSIETRYGFNLMNIRIWFIDLLKTLFISSLLGCLILLIIFLLILHGGQFWWVFGWILTGVFELLILWLFPVVIAPFFNKFEPLEDKVIKDRIKELMKKAGFQVAGVFKMDETKRSKHTNAYFTGLGKTKRIVLYDTLLASHPLDEILAILAHEIGHWKKRHIFKHIIFLEIISFLVFWGANKFLNWNLSYITFGFKEPIFYVGLFLYALFISLIGFFIYPLEAFIIRQFEREADDFSRGLIGSSEPICNVLKRLAIDNLENIVPHPLFVWYYYSHPPLKERILRIKEVNTLP